MKKLKGIISSSRLLTSSTSPIVLIKGCPGKIIVPYFIVYKMVNVTTAYETNSEGLKLQYTGAIGELFQMSILKENEAFTSSSNLIWYGTVAEIKGKDLILRHGGVNPTLGDGDLKLKLFYTYI